MSDTTTAQPQGKKINRKYFTVAVAVLFFAWLGQQLADHQPNLAGVNWDAIYGIVTPAIIPALLILIGIGTFKMPIGKALLLVGIALAFWNFHGEQYYNPLESGKRAVINMGSAHEVKAVARDRPEVVRYIGGNDRDFGSALKQFASKDAARLNDIDAALIRQARSLPILRIMSPQVKGNQNAPLTFFTAREPILVIVSQTDTVRTGSRPYEFSRADGIYKTDPEWKFASDKKTVEQVPKYGGIEGAHRGSYKALIARTCTSAYSCNRWVETGFAFAVCGGGETQLWINELVRFGPLEHTEEFVGAEGAYSFEAHLDHPLARAFCNGADPGQTIVPQIPLQISTN